LLVRLGRRAYHLDEFDLNGEVTDLAPAIGTSLDNDRPQRQTFLLVSNGIHDDRGAAYGR